VFAAHFGASNDPRGGAVFADDGRLEILAWAKGSFWSMMGGKDGAVEAPWRPEPVPA
jgi:hypothetical protein